MTEDLSPLFIMEFFQLLVRLCEIPETHEYLLESMVLSPLFNLFIQNTYTDGSLWPLRELLQYQCYITHKDIQQIERRYDEILEILETEFNYNFVDLLLRAHLQLRDRSILSLLQKLPTDRRENTISQFLTHITKFSLEEQQELLSYLWTHYRTVITRHCLRLFLSALPNATIPKQEIEKELNEYDFKFLENRMTLNDFRLVMWIHHHNISITADKFHQLLQKYKEELLPFSSELIKETAITYLWGNKWFTKYGCQLYYQQYPAYIRSKIKAVLSLTLIQNCTVECQFRRIPRDILYHILDELLLLEQQTFQWDTAPLSFAVRLMVSSDFAEKCVLVYLFGWQNEGWLWPNEFLKGQILYWTKQETRHSNE